VWASAFAHIIRVVDPLFATSRGRRRALLLCGALLATAAFGSATAHAGTFTRGFVDDVWFDPPADGLSQQAWLTKTKTTGAKLAQIEVDWPGVEPKVPPPGASPTSPAATQFDFSGLDAEVEELTRAGLQPVFLVTDAPRWAQGKGGTATAYAEGGYKPNAKAFGNLAEALAKRYSGTYPNPLNPHMKLPRVRYMQAWAEANTSFHLAPQWTRVGGRAVNTGAIIYRQMLNAFYAGVKAGDPSTKVLFSGLEGYGDAPFSGLNRTHPVTFVQNVLCLSATSKRV
jgi:ribosomal protein L27